MTNNANDYPVERNILALLDAAFQNYVRLPMGAFDTAAESFKNHIIEAQKIILARVGGQALAIAVPVQEEQKQGNKPQPKLNIPKGKER